MKIELPTIPLSPLSQAQARLELDQKRPKISDEDRDLLQSIKDHLKKSSQDKIYLNKDEVADLLGVSKRSVDQMRRKAIIPEPKNIPLSDTPKGTKGRKVLRWKTQEVIDWIDSY